MFLALSHPPAENEWRKNASIAIKKWIKEKWQLADHITILVTEIRCSDPGCPNKTTIISIIQENQHKKFSIKKPLLYVRKWDIAALTIT